MMILVIENLNINISRYDTIQYNVIYIPDTTSDSHNSSSSSTSVSNNEDVDPNEQNNICCILDSVNCLMILHRNTFKDENNLQKMKEIQDSCIKCLTKILKLYKVIFFYLH